MELDNFRRQWQQQPAQAGPPLPAAETLQAMVALRTDTPVARMLRNARVEITSTAVSLGVAGAALLLGNAQRLLPFWILLLATGLLAAFDYYYKRLLLRRLHLGSADMRSHVARQLQSLRALLQINYWFVLGTLVVVSGFLLYAAYVHLPQLFEGNAHALWQRGLWLGLTLLVSVAITHWIVRWQLQQQYGQHLARLEAALRELEG